MTPMVNCVTTAPPNLSDSQPPKGRTAEPSSGPRNAYKATGGAFRLRHSVLTGVHFFVAEILAIQCFRKITVPSSL